MTEKPSGRTILPVFLPGVVPGSTREGTFYPASAEAECVLDFEVPDKAAYGIVAADGRMDPPVKPGDVVVACPGVPIGTGCPVAVKLRGRDEVIFGSYHSVGSGFARFVPANEKFPLIEVACDEIEWMHTAVITIPKAEFRRTSSRRKKPPKADA